MPTPHKVPQAARLPAAAKSRVAATKQRFVLTGVLVEGATAFRNVDFLPFYQDYLGKQITLDDLHKIADAFTHHYHQAGYFLSHAFIPAQRIEFGVVRIRMVEGYLSHWRMLDSSNGRDPKIDKILATAMAQRPLRRATLTTAFQDLAALPDLNIHPYVQPLAKPLGAYDLVLKVGRKHFDGGISIDNHGSDYIGPIQGALTLRVFDLSGHHEIYQVKMATVSHRDELRYLDASTDWLLTASGLRLQAGAALTSANPGGYLESLDAHIESNRFRLGISYPIRRAANHAITLGMTFYSYRSRTDLDGIKRLEDRLNTVVLSYHHLFQSDESTSHAVGISVTKGMKIAGSKIVDTQTGAGLGQVDFTKLNIDYRYLQLLRLRWAFTTELNGQYALDALPGSERYSIGGAQFGRAYDPSEITGDHGLAARMELAYRGTLNPPVWQSSPYGFYDLGAVRQYDSRNAAFNASLASLGLGLRISGESFSAYLEAAKPMTRAVASQGDGGKQVRLFAGMAYQF